MSGMPFFTITYDDGFTKASEDFPCPVRLPQPGDVYKLKTHVATLAGRSYRPGDRLEIIERTEAAPHYRKNSLGNLRVKCPFFTSVWSNIEVILEEGNLELVTEAAVA